eukprot:12917916-Prorocentrum_lima.AAC.1
MSRSFEAELLLSSTLRKEEVVDNGVIGITGKQVADPNGKKAVYPDDKEQQQQRTQKQQQQW